MVTSVMTGLGSALLVTFLMAALAAWLLVNERMAIGYADAISLMITALSAFAGCYITGRISGEKKLWESAITAIAFLLVLLSITAIFFDGSYHGVWKTLGVTVIGWLLAQLPLKRRTGKKSGYKKRKIYR